MAVPTRFIEKEEFEELMLSSGTTINLYKLAAIPFEPPTPDAPAGAMNYDNYPAVRVIMLNVAEPRLYRDEKNIVFVVYPIGATMDYHDAQDMHPRKNAWCYRITPYSWDSDSDFLDSTYLFHKEELPKFDLEDEETH